MVPILIKISSIVKICNKWGKYFHFAVQLISRRYEICWVWKKNESGFLPWGGTESSRQRLGHVSDELERQGPGEDNKNNGQHYEAMEEYAHEHSHEVHAQLANYHIKAIHFQQFGGDQEEHADRRHPARQKSINLGFCVLLWCVLTKWPNRWWSSSPGWASWRSRAAVHPWAPSCPGWFPSRWKRRPDPGCWCLRRSRAWFPTRASFSLQKPWVTIFDNSVLYSEFIHLFRFHWVVAF